MIYRGDLSRTSREAAEISGMDFDIIYHFLWDCIKKNHWNVKIIREKIKVFPGKVFLDEGNQLFKMPRYAGTVEVSNSADYWEGRILARQEASGYYD